jgi:hypothetical protein
MTLTVTTIRRRNTCNLGTKIEKFEEREREREIPREVGER